MEMSVACTPPLSATVSDADRKHPRFGDYQQYRNAMAAQLVYCQSFASWLRATEEHEKGRVIVFQVTSPDAALAPGWYRNEFLPLEQYPETFGPYATESAANYE